LHCCGDSLKSSLQLKYFVTMLVIFIVSIQEIFNSKGPLTPHVTTPTGNISISDRQNIFKCIWRNVFELLISHQQGSPLTGKFWWLVHVGGASGSLRCGILVQQLHTRNNLTTDGWIITKLDIWVSYEKSSYFSVFIHIEQV
jgi:hypothetical protein